MNLLKRKRFLGSGIIQRLTDTGFGLVKREGTEEELSFHSKELRGIAFDELREGDSFGFDIIAGSKGLWAVNIERNGWPHDEEIIDRDDSDAKGSNAYCCKDIY